MNKLGKLLRLTFIATVGIGYSAAASAQISNDTIKIGFITDMSGVYADVDGPAGAESIKMAIADMGGMINGKKIEFISADHQNKADIAASKAREWFDQQGVDMIIGGSNSATNLAMAKVAADKKKPFIAIGAGTARLTNEECTAYTIHYAYDTVALARGTSGALVKQGYKDWFFLTADYVFGISLEKDASDVVKSSGGRVIWVLCAILSLRPIFLLFCCKPRVPRPKCLAWLTQVATRSIRSRQPMNLVLTKK